MGLDTQANPAETEPTEVSARTSTPVAAMVVLSRMLRGTRSLDPKGCFSQPKFSLPASATASFTHLLTPPRGPLL